MKKLSFFSKAGFKPDYFNFYWFFISVLAFTFFLSGCSSYQYVSLVGSLPKNNENQFIRENDTVKITYSFTGNNCPVTIQVFNKLQIPIYVDWSKSSVIINGEKESLWTGSASIYATTQGMNINWDKTTSTSIGDINGTLQRNEKVSFIPPRSFVNISRIFLMNGFFNVREADSHSVVPLATTEDGDTGKKYLFQKKHTPLQFRTFISLSTKQNFSIPSYFENSFWVNQITQSLAKPNTLINKSTNQCYVWKTTAAGSIIGFTVVEVSILILAAVLAK